MRLALLLAAALLSLCAQAEEAPLLGIHADEPAPTIARLLVERLPQELRPRLQSFQDADALRASLAAGEVDLAFLEEPLGPIPDINAVSDLYPAVLHVLVPEAMAEAGLGELLTSGPVWAGAPGGIGHTLALRLARDYGAGKPDLLDDPWTRTPEIYFIFGGLLGEDALSRLDGYRLYSVGEPASVAGGSLAAGIGLRYPNLRAFMLPAELYPGLSREPALTLAVKTLLVARADLDEELVYELAMAINRLKPAIASAYPLAGIEELGRSAHAPRALAWHPGAQRFLDRELPSFIERYAEFMGASVTIGIALVSLGVALYRRRKQARKDRLDRYYREALQYRDALQGDTQDREAIVNGLRGLQEEVFDLLMKERIDADSALIAFLSLSNQLLHEAESG